MAEVRRFFDHRAPELLAASVEQARGVQGRCRFDVADKAGRSGSWIVDFTADPATIATNEESGSDCRMSLTAEDLLEMIEDPSAGQVRAWQGRLRTHGDQAVLRRAASVLFPSPRGDNGAYAGYYTSLSRLVPDPRVTCMNHGYAESVDEDFSWLDGADHPWRFALNLIRRTLRGALIDGARVLDVGCGRGGPAAYIARYSAAEEVTGVDACADSIELCRRRHRQERLRFMHGYADDLPFDDASFDVVLNVESSHCYLDRPAFFAEVSRVLKPGGRFCYADIFQGDEFEQSRRWLDDQPALHAGEAVDVTPQVVRAIDLNRETLTETLTSAADPKLGNTAIIADLIRSINVTIYDNYVSGRWRYYVWPIEKAVT
jgi:O-methyltransferase